MNKSKGRLEIAIVCIIIGIMIIMQMKSIRGLGGIVTTQRAEELLIELNQVKKENTELSNKAAGLEAQVNKYETLAADNDAYISQLLDNVNQVKASAGLTDVSGEGIVITLDYDNVEKDGFDPFLYNSELLLLLVNELNAAGAEAISINDERIINTSEIRLAGSHININGSKFSRPFVFKVIGDSKTLKSAIMIRAGIVEIMKANYISVSIKESAKVEIAKFDGVIDYKYAKPVVKE
ncbi:MAG: DUF881 domain-containing protein [Eubacteriaceae bacterium]|nr:DUF881 domain-containing protein [Eubacteriaceae bacterium]